MSSDAARWGLLLIALRNQTCLTAVWVQADARVALGCCRTADTLFQPPAHPQRLSWPVHSRGWCELFSSALGWDRDEDPMGGRLPPSRGVQGPSKPAWELAGK